MLIIGGLDLLSIRQKQNKSKENNAMVNAVRKGDEVITQGG